MISFPVPNGWVRMRFFTGFTLSLRSRPFVALRVTKGEGSE